MWNAKDEWQMIRAAIKAIVLLGAVTFFNGKQHDPSCCRSPETEVRYTRPPSDITPPDDAGILQIDHSGGQAILTILHPNIPRDEFVGFSNYQELTTSDLGKTWRRRSLLNQVGSVLATRANDFARAPSDPKVLYRYLQESGMYLRSVDGGRTWLPPESRVEGLAKSEFILRNGGNVSYAAQFHLAGIDPHDPLKIYASVSVVPWASLVNFEGDLLRHDLPGLYVSADGGDSWTQLFDSLLNQAPIGLSSSDRNLMYGQTPDGVVKSSDGGTTWAAIGQQKLMALPPHTRANEVSKKLLDLFEVLQFAIDPSNENIVYVVSNKGIYRSLDGGMTWCLLDLGFDEVGGMHSMTMNPAHPVEIFVGTTRGVFYSSDRGCHFSKIFPTN
jgi:hypothetical protein